MKLFRCIAAAGVLVLASASAAAAAPSAPPGNNGTIKTCVGETCTDFPPQETPHLPCEFSLEFRGYDEGDLQATYEIVAWSPTGDGRVLASGETDIGEDAAGGAVDLDATVPLDLTQALSAMRADGFDPHPVQGWHVKITVHAEGSIGADVKHKVVWIEDCTPTPTQTTPPPTTTPPTTPPTTTASTPPSVEANSPTPHSDTTSVKAHTGTKRRTPAPGTAFTGSDTGLPLGIGAGLLVLGMTALAVARRRSTG